MKVLSVVLLVGMCVAVFANPQNRPCPGLCPALFSPVCAVLRGQHRTFSNECLLNATICRERQPWRVVAKCACVDQRNSGSYVPGFTPPPGAES